MEVKNSVQFYVVEFICTGVTLWLKYELLLIGNDRQGSSLGREDTCRCFQLYFALQYLKTGATFIKQCHKMEPTIQCTQVLHVCKKKRGGQLFQEIAVTFGLWEMRCLTSAFMQTMKFVYVHGGGFTFKGIFVKIGTILGTVLWYK